MSGASALHDPVAATTPTEHFRAMARNNLWSFSVRSIVRYRERASAVLGHLFVHQMHHRGQVHAMLAGTNVSPPQLDEFFLAQDAPLRAAEEAALGFAS